MPIVVDANAANALAGENCHSSRQILAWVRRGGVVVTGGRLQEELRRTTLRALLAQWSAAGRLRILPAQDCESMEHVVANQCQSDDPHVLAVVILGNAGVLISGDLQLQRDVKDRSIVTHVCKIISCDRGRFSNRRIVLSLLAKFAG